LNDANTHVSANVLQESNFWPKKIRVTNVETYNRTNKSGRMRLSTYLKLIRISLQESYFEFFDVIQSNVTTVLKPLPEHNCQQCFNTW
jgi:hypothetical protein